MYTIKNIFKSKIYNCLYQWPWQKNRKAQKTKTNKPKNDEKHKNNEDPKKEKKPQNRQKRQKRQKQRKYFRISSLPSTFLFLNFLIILLFLFEIV